MENPFVIGVTYDFQQQGLGQVEEYVREALQKTPDVSYCWLPPFTEAVEAEAADNCDAILSLGISWAAKSFQDLQRLSLIARWGVGYDMIDVEACTAAGVALAITPDSIRQPVAEGALTLALALLKRLPEKNNIVRNRQWRGQLADFGRTTTGVALGSVGLGNIGSDFMRLAAPFHFRRLLAYDPYATPEKAQTLNVELVSLDTLLRECDVIAIHCPLMPETQHLIGARELSLMKPDAYLVNTARGPIVDQQALYKALCEKRIAGAALDVLEQEPPSANDPLLDLDNVIFAPHAIAWSRELMHDVTIEACQACLALANGEWPQHVVNQEVLEHPAFTSKFDRIRGIV